MSASEKASVFHILAFVFDDRHEARQMENDVRVGQYSAGYHILARAVVDVDEKGKTHIHEPGHGAVGTTLGVAGGGLLALIGGPLGILAMAVAGGVVGGIAGRHFGKVIPEDELKKLGDQLEPNSSAFLALVEDLYAESVIDDMKGFNANVVTLTVGDEVSGELAQAFAADIQAEESAADSSNDSSDQSSEDTSD